MKEERLTKEEIQLWAKIALYSTTFGMIVSFVIDH